MIRKRSETSSIGTSAANVEAFLGRHETRSSARPSPDAAALIVKALKASGTLAIDRIVMIAREGGIAELGVVLKALGELRGAGLIVMRDGDPPQPDGATYALTRAGLSVAASS